MAFREIDPDTAARMASHATETSGALGWWHTKVAADLLKLAETPADANAALAAVKAWRDDQEARRVRWIKAALLQITSGDQPEAVCAGLGFGRTALQQVVRDEKHELGAYAGLVYKAHPKRKKVA
ncbi:hypothetical protein [Mycolicibacterium brisbanense]